MAERRESKANAKGYGTNIGGAGRNLTVFLLGFFLSGKNHRILPAGKKLTLRGEYSSASHRREPAVARPRR